MSLTLDGLLVTPQSRKPSTFNGEAGEGLVSLLPLGSSGECANPQSGSFDAIWLRDRMPSLA